jgi:hypothetical protein
MERRFEAEYASAVDEAEQEFLQKTETAQLALDEANVKCERLEEAWQLVRALLSESSSPTN